MKRDMKAEKKIMDVLLDNVSGEKMYLSQIARASDTSTSTCHQILEKKVAEGQIERVKFGNLRIYFLDQNDPLVSQMKVARAIELIRPLLKELQEVSQKIILFGSSAEGKDTTESDFDFFVLSDEKKEVQRIISKSEMGRKIQPLIKNFLEWTQMKKKDKFLYEEIKKGIVLWEEKNERV